MFTGGGLVGMAHGAGAGLPLLLIHAFPFDHRMWSPQISALQAGRTVLVPDLVGFGATPDLPGPVSLERQADELADFLKARGVERAVLCGLSMGGYVALAFAERHPALMAGLVLADTRATADSEPVRAGRTATSERVLREGVGFFADEMLPKLLSPEALRDRPQLSREVREIMTSQDPSAVAGALVAMRDRPSREEVLSRVPCPVLVMVGEKDGMTTPAEAESMVRLCPSASLFVVPGAGHLANMEAPAPFNGALEAFLRQI